MRSQTLGGGLLAILSLVAACGGEEPKPSGATLVRAQSAPQEERTENHAPVVERVVLNPPRPLAGQRIEARIDVSDADGDPIRLELTWWQDGREVRRGAQTALVPEHLRKGQRVEVEVVATDGSDRSEPARAEVTAGNQAPLIQSLYLAPDGEVAPGQDVTAAPQAIDPDGDPLEYTFEWLLNGQPVRGADQARFDTSKLQRGDRLQARVRVSDGEAESPLAESMTLELANRAPRFLGLPSVAASDGAFHTDLQAEDPDGDRNLRFRVVQGPPGLTVDAISGRLSWRPGQDAAGTHPVEVAVGDSFGAESAMRFDLTVTPSGAGAAPPAKKSEADEERDE